MGVMLDKLDKRSKLEKEVSEVSKQDNKIAKLKEKLDDYNFSTASEFYEMAAEIGYENLSPSTMSHRPTAVSTTAFLSPSALPLIALPKSRAPSI